MRRLLTLLGTAGLFAPMLLAQAPPQMPKPGPAQKRIGYFAGHWTSEGETKPSPFGPAGKFTMKDHNEWLPWGFFLVMHSEGKTAVESTPVTPPPARMAPPRTPPRPTLPAPAPKAPVAAPIVPPALPSGTRVISRTLPPANPRGLPSPMPGRPAASKRLKANSVGIKTRRRS